MTGHRIDRHQPCLVADLEFADRLTGATLDVQVRAFDLAGRVSPTASDIKHVDLAPQDTAAP